MIAVHVKNHLDQNSEWEFFGVFTDAKAACLETTKLKSYFEPIIWNGEDISTYEPKFKFSACNIDESRMKKIISTI